MSRFGIVCPKTAEECVYVTDDLRFCVLSERILRVEKCAGGRFVDEPSQAIFCRNFAKPHFNVTENGDKVSVITNSTEFVVDKKTLATACVIDGKRVVPDARKNLGGTARTLDATAGRVKIGQGIMSSNGVTVYDDSKTCLLEEDGSLRLREKGSKDIYVFAFGRDFAGGLREFFSLTGYPPVLPKYALGNWWSRYHAYTAEEYLNLMDEFAAKRVPLTVATVDMDWHIVDNVPKDCKSANPFQGAGWTGYTFEKSLFPDYKAFFAELKKRGLAITLNLHPRDGVRYFEEQYADMARANGIDPATRRTVEFDLTDRKFLESYFDILHHPYEDAGVDFWWIDWQQGTKSKMKNVDPLWMLNHYHFLDAGRSGRTPLILSRYAGIGSHRYPLGFSGDTFVCWKSLQLQPWFTATAANVGYTWWSHDIGGHMFGKGNRELYLRWLQFGVFSPVNRLHSTKKDYYSKEPWLYGEETEALAEKYLRLRHRLLPYLYTANRMTAEHGVPLCRPMYYDYDTVLAYSARDEYMFGNLVAAPVITPAKKSGLAETKVWLPEGEWTNIFTGEKHVGEKLFIERSIPDTMPVYAKAGTIIPLLAGREGNSTQFDELEVLVFKGDGKYILLDEKGSVEFAVRTEGERVVFSIKPSSDCVTKTIKVRFCDLKSPEIVAKNAIGKDADSVTVKCCDTEITATESPVASVGEASAETDENAPKIAAWFAET